MRPTFAHLALTLALAAAGCGGFDTPDTSTGLVKGTLTGAGTGAYAYPVGRPDLQVAIGQDGTFSIAGVPAGSQRIVLFDGGAQGAGRAEAVAIEVSGGNENVLAARAAADMPLASTVYATAVVQNGAAVTGALFKLVGTPLTNVGTQGSTVAALYPVPGGLFDVGASLAGFKDGLAQDQAVAEALSLDVEVPLQVDDDDAEPGCCSGGCRAGLSCDESSGYCYECVGDGDCVAPATCDPDTHTCTGNGTTFEACSACNPQNNGSECGTGGNCIVSGTTGYCSRACGQNGATCPSGFDCVSNECVPPLGCTSYLAVYGASCFKDDTCKYALKGGVCLGSEESGYCSAGCQTSADCPWSWTCSSSSFCVPP
jgi:hypothetical protein